MMHLVNRLRFDIRCSDEQEAFDVRLNLAHVLEDTVRDAIDSVCNEYVGEDETIRIDTIELDLGPLNRRAIERDLGWAIRSRFEAALREQLVARGPGTQRTPKRASYLELFRHVMLHGTQPWWEPGEQTDVDTLARELAVSMPTELREFLYRHAGREALWRRIAYQLRDRGRLAIVDLIPELNDAQSRVLQILFDAEGASASREWSEEARSKATAALAEALLRAAPEILARPQDHSLVARLTQAAVDNVEAAAGGTAATADASRRALHPDRARPVSQAADIRSDATMAIRTQEAEEGERSLTERFVVRHAGLILLAPFFARFFVACDLREERQWGSREAQYTAVHLLRYLCTGEKQCAEHTLTLEKVCCGVTVEDPLPRDVELRVEQMAEASALLASVIEHWKALGSTSIAGLRATFLTRDGLLSRKDEDWLLRVERKTLDVLVDSIPWGYSTVALPWNNYVIHVEW